MEAAFSGTREPRTPFAGMLRYRCGGEDKAPAQWANVSRVGAGVRLGRYLRPGRLLQLCFRSPEGEGRKVELDARVVWCRPAGEVDFMAGVHIVRREPTEALAFAALVHEARRASRETADAEAAATPWHWVRTREPKPGLVENVKYAPAV